MAIAMGSLVCSLILPIASSLPHCAPIISNCFMAVLRRFRAMGRCAGITVARDDMQSRLQAHVPRRGANTRAHVRTCARAHVQRKLDLRSDVLSGPRNRPRRLTQITIFDPVSEGGGGWDGVSPSDFQTRCEQMVREVTQRLRDAARATWSHPSRAVLRHGPGVRSHVRPLCCLSACTGHPRWWRPICTGNSVACQLSATSHHGEPPVCPPTSSILQH